MVEQLPLKQRVVGSSPTRLTNILKQLASFLGMVFKMFFKRALPSVVRVRVDGYRSRGLWANAQITIGNCGSFLSVCIHGL